MDVDECISRKKEEQGQGWYITVDLEIHCMCGRYIENSDEDEYRVTCPTCGQNWLVTARAIPIDN